MWHLCSKEEPPRGRQIIAYGPGHGEMINMDICVWDEDTWWDEGGTELSDCGWTHWMELPEKPK